MNNKQRNARTIQTYINKCLRRFLGIYTRQNLYPTDRLKIRLGKETRTR